VTTTLAVARPTAWDRWRAFAFDPVDPAPMAAIRIVVGLLTIGWALSYLPDASFFLGSHGAVPHTPPWGEDWAWTHGIGNPVLALLLLALAAVFMTVGLGSRVASVAVLVLLIAIQRRDPQTLNSGDLLLRVLVFYVILMPSGECWSLDARIRQRFGRAPRWRAPWALRLLQIQVSMLYFFALWAKLRGASWANGTAVGLALQIGDLQRIALPHGLLVQPTVAALMTYGTLATETFLVFGLWVPRLRYAAMAAGVGLHLGIDATILVGWFSWATITAYLAFVPGDSLRSLQNRLRGSVHDARPPLGNLQR